MSGLVTAGTAASGLVLPHPAAAGGSGVSGVSGAPSIYYSPHQDDETIGMSGSILRDKAAGRPVYLVLVTGGENDGLRRQMNVGACAMKNRCPAPGHRHTLNWPEGGDNVVRGRTAEFRRAAGFLGVDRIFRLGMEDDIRGEEDDDPKPANYAVFVDRLEQHVRSFVKTFPGASHTFAAGWLDSNITHKACSDVANRLRNDIEDMSFLHIYSYVQYSPADRDRGGAADVLHIPADHFKRKLQAIAAYRTWSPSRGLYSLGWHSVSDFFESASKDPREFRYRLPAAYRFGIPSADRNLTGDPS